MPYEPLLADLKERNIPVLDLAPHLEEATRSEGIEPLFMPGGHYSRLGNKVVADALASFLMSN